MSRIQTMRTYVILNVTDSLNVYDEDFVHWDSRSDEELREDAFNRKRKLEEQFINEKFKVVLREEFEEDIE